MEFQNSGVPDTLEGMAIGKFLSKNPLTRS